MPRRAPRIDANQPEIVKSFRKLGCTVQHLHMVGDGCPDLETIPHNTRIPKQPINLLLPVSGHTHRVEPVKGSTVVLPLAKDGRPAETSLGDLENEKLELENEELENEELENEKLLLELKLENEKLLLLLELKLEHEKLDDEKLQLIHKHSYAKSPAE